MPFQEFHSLEQSIPVIAESSICGWLNSGSRFVLKKYRLGVAWTKMFQRQHKDNTSLSQHYCMLVHCIELLTSFACIKNRSPNNITEHWSPSRFDTFFERIHTTHSHRHCNINSSQTHSYSLSRNHAAIMNIMIIIIVIIRICKFNNSPLLCCSSSTLCSMNSYLFPLPSSNLIYSALRFNLKR